MKTKIHLKKTRLALQLVPAATMLVALAVSVPVSAQTEQGPDSPGQGEEDGCIPGITTFDAPGAGTGVSQGTYGINVSPSGEVIGFTRDANDVRHGFIRSKHGSFTIFNAPGAGTAAGQGTRAYAVNPSGEIAGFFFDSATVAHGYVRSKHGVIAVFNAPGAGTGPGQGTFVVSALNLNPNGAIAGNYADSSGVRHGFLRHRNGTFTTFDVAGAGTSAGQGTLSYAIDENEAITGYYLDGTGVSHGFLRKRNGVITTFDVPGFGTGPGQGTYGGGFDPNGSIMGNYYTADNVSHGFLRKNNGTFTTFDAPGAGSVPNSDDGTFPFGINTKGDISGWYVDNDDVNHGFVRNKHGAFTTFDVPGAGAGVFVFSIAPNGAVAGYFWDANTVIHGLTGRP